MRLSILIFLFCSLAPGASRYWVGGAINSNWGENTAGVSNWSATSGGVVKVAPPGSSDDVFFDANSGSATATMDATYTLLSLDCTGYTGTIDANTRTLAITAGPLTLVAGMVWTTNSTGAVLVNTTGTVNITTGGQTLAVVTLTGSGVKNLMDSFTCTGLFTFSGGTINTNNNTVVVPGIAKTNATATTINLGSSDITVTSINAIGLTGSNITLNAGTSVIRITDTSVTNKVFAGGGKTWNDIVITAGGTGVVVFSGANTYHDFTIGAPKSVRFTISITQTFTGTFGCTGSVGNVITIDSSTGGTAATLSKASGTVSCDYLSLKDSAATGGASWYAGANSTDVSGNTGWIFTAPPVVTAGVGLLLGVGY